MCCSVGRRIRDGRLRFLYRQDVRGNRIHVFVRHGGEVASDGQHGAGRGAVFACTTAAQIHDELFPGPRFWRRAKCIQWGRFPAVDDAAVECMSRFFTANRIERRMTRGAVSEAIDQQLAAIPLGIFRGIRRLLAGAKEQHIPEG